ncbi:hypothetical protein C0989_004109 [Termitomyces sp. Mn162]|nr:hypothetical protein C0989_004109 [Termitomyces sp. Mn162]
MILKVRSLIVSHGVVIGQAIVQRRVKMITLMNTGDIWFPGRHDVQFAIPNFIPVDLAERCWLDKLSLSLAQKAARIEVLRRIREMECKAEIRHNMVSMKCVRVNAYDQVKSPDPDAWNTTTLRDIAQLISSELDELTLCGLHKYIMSNPVYFVADQCYDINQIIHVRPQTHIDNINTIKEWTRMSDGPIQSFAAKAGRLIPEYQQIQYASRAESPSCEPAAHAWTEDDRTILKFLHNSLRQARATQLDPYSLGVSHVLKQINPDKLVEDCDLYQTLINIGALAPWQDPASLDPALGLDIEPEPTSSWKKEQEAIATRGFVSMASSGTETPLGPEDFHRTDPLESVRHDFGDLPVFVIDDANAQELDDGISIERIPSEPDNLWMHVHVADPASLIPPTHVLAKEASIRATTVYFKHRSWPLFPKSLMAHPTLGLSLGRKTDESPLRVITFSGKVDKTGQLLDYKVRAGLIKNVNVITYEQANEVLGLPNDLCWYPFGRQPPHLRSSFKPAHLTDSCVKDLRDIQEVADRFLAQRYNAGIIISAKNSVSLEPIVKPPPEVFGPISEPKTFRGFPTFEYSVIKASDLDSGAHVVVAESMKMAARIASRFCTEHNIPIMRRFATPSIFSSSVDIQEIRDMRTPNCHVPGHFILDKLEVPCQAGYSLEPKAHYPLGLPEGEGYTRSTSPLRRYIDLVVHWQIHHALLGSKASKPSPLFNTEEIWEIAKAGETHEKTARVLERVHERFWQFMFIKRWAQENGGFDNSDGPLSNLKAYTLSKVNLNSRTGVLQVQIECPQLGIFGMLENLSDRDMPAGSEVEVKLRNIALGTRPQIHFNLRN